MSREGRIWELAQKIRDCMKKEVPESAWNVCPRSTSQIASRLRAYPESKIEEIERKMGYNGHKDYEEWDVCNECWNTHYQILLGVVENYSEDEQVDRAMTLLPDETSSGTKYTRERVDKALDGIRED